MRTDSYRDALCSVLNPNSSAQRSLHTLNSLMILMSRIFSIWQSCYYIPVWHAPYYITLSFVACLVLPIFTHYLINGTFSEKTEHIRCISIFSIFVRYISEQRVHNYTGNPPAKYTIVLQCKHQTLFLLVSALCRYHRCCT